MTRWCACYIIYLSEEYGNNIHEMLPYTNDNIFHKADYTDCMMFRPEPETRP